jgi:hypothetical protein
MSSYAAATLSWPQNGLFFQGELISGIGQEGQPAPGTSTIELDVAAGGLLAVQFEISAPRIRYYPGSSSRDFTSSTNQPPISALRSEQGGMFVRLGGSETSTPMTEIFENEDALVAGSIQRRLEFVVGTTLRNSLVYNQRAGRGTGISYSQEKGKDVVAELYREKHSSSS